MSSPDPVVVGMYATFVAVCSMALFGIIYTGLFYFYKYRFDEKLAVRLAALVVLACAALVTSIDDFVDGVIMYTVSVGPEMALLRIVWLFEVFSHWE